jgi:hypothetical protein
MRNLYRLWHASWHASLDHNDPLRSASPDWKDFNLMEGVYFTDPPPFYPPELRVRIQKLIVYLYRIAVGYRSYTKYLIYA